MKILRLYYGFPQFIELFENTLEMDGTRKALVASKQLPLIFQRFYFGQSGFNRLRIYQNSISNFACFDQTSFYIVAYGKLRNL
jgi:hypothetical protein